MAHENKKEIEIFYKTHNLSLKECAQHFGINYRTIARWVQKEGWEAGSAIKNVKFSNAGRRANDRVLSLEEVRLKNEIKQNLGESVNEIDSLILENLLTSSTDDILTKAMSINYIQKNIALAAVLSKDALLRLVSAQKARGNDPKDTPIIIACAEKVLKNFVELQGAIYGKNIERFNGADLVENDIDKMDNNQIRLLISQLEKAEG